MVATLVAKFTDARTPGILFSFDSTRFAQAAQDIPEISSSTRCTGAAGASVAGVVTDIVCVYLPTNSFHAKKSFQRGKKFPALMA
ncbi:hypothetical protein [Mycobacterium sp. 050134]|uniref:hypothetical protein n=1 Tax=Mycobacterium sp. 050134 TaxID=3096111 RepID=UPI002EDA787A